MKSPALKIAAAAALAFAATAMAQGYGYGPGFGPGMRGGPGMYGYGPGMGYGYGPRAGANLTDEQRSRIAALREEHRDKNWQTMGELRAEQFKLRDLYAANADAGAIAEQQKKVDGLREQMFRQRNEMRHEMDSVLAR